jgi:hypothetical protein
MKKILFKMEGIATLKGNNKQYLPSSLINLCEIQKLKAGAVIKYIKNVEKEKLQFNNLIKEFDNIKNINVFMKKITKFHIYDLLLFIKV